MCLNVFNRMQTTSRYPLESPLGVQVGAPVLGGRGGGLSGGRYEAGAEGADGCSCQNTCSSLLALALRPTGCLIQDLQAATTLFGPYEDLNSKVGGPEAAPLESRDAVEPEIRDRVILDDMSTAWMLENTVFAKRVSQKLASHVLYQDQYKNLRNFKS